MINNQMYNKNSDSRLQKIENSEDKFDSNEKLINQMEIEILSTSLIQIIEKVKF